MSRSADDAMYTPHVVRFAKHRMADVEAGDAAAHRRVVPIGDARRAQPVGVVGASRPPSVRLSSLLPLALLLAVGFVLYSREGLGGGVSATQARTAPAADVHQRAQALLHKLMKLQRAAAARSPSSTPSAAPATPTSTGSREPIQKQLIPPEQDLGGPIVVEDPQRRDSQLHVAPLQPPPLLPPPPPTASQPDGPPRDPPPPVSGGGGGGGSSSIRGAVSSLVKGVAAEAGAGLAGGLRRAQPAMRHISIPEPVMKPDGYYDDAQARSRLQGVIDAFWKGVGGGGGVGGGSPPPPHVHDPADARLHPADIMVATYYTPTGKFAYFRQCNYGKYLHANRWRYASIHGYQYDVGAEVLDDTRPLPWQKVLWITRWLRRAKWVLLIDADALISGMAPRVEDLIDDDHDLIFARDGNGINSGIALFKSTPLTFQFLEDAYRSVQHLNHPWWEQKAFMDLLESRAEYRAKLKVVPQRALNSYPPGLLGPEGWWARGDLVLHFPGTKGGDYARAIELPQPNVEGAFPACRSGDETGAWERWAQGPAAAGD